MSYLSRSSDYYQRSDYAVAYTVSCGYGRAELIGDLVVAGVATGLTVIEAVLAETDFHLGLT